MLESIIATVQVLTERKMALRGNSPIGSGFMETGIFSAKNKMRVCSSLNEILNSVNGCNFIFYLFQRLKH